MKISLKLTAIMVALGLFAVVSVSIMPLARSQSSIIALSEDAVSMGKDSAGEVVNFLENYYENVINRFKAID